MSSAQVPSVIRLRNPGVDISSAHSTVRATSSGEISSSAAELEVTKALVSQLKTQLQQDKEAAIEAISCQICFDPNIYARS